MPIETVSEENARLETLLVEHQNLLASLAAYIPDNYEPEEVNWGKSVGNEVW